jgi:hypothetical protein
MNIPTEQYVPFSREPGYAESCANSWVEEGKRNPQGTNLSDYEVSVARTKIEKRLPSDPGAGTNLFDAVLEAAREAGMADRPKLRGDDDYEQC